MLGFEDVVSLLLLISQNAVEIRSTDGGGIAFVTHTEEAWEHTLEFVAENLPVLSYQIQKPISVVDPGGQETTWPYLPSTRLVALASA